MRNKMNDDEKKQKINISINSGLNELLEKEMKDTGKKKSQVLEKAINMYIDTLKENNLTDSEIRTLNDNLLKNKNNE